MIFPRLTLPETCQHYQHWANIIIAAIFSNHHWVMPHCFIKDQRPHATLNLSCWRCQVQLAASAQAHCVSSLCQLQTADQSQGRCHNIDQSQPEDDLPWLTRPSWACPASLLCLRLWLLTGQDNDWLLHKWPKKMSRSIPKTFFWQQSGLSYVLHWLKSCPQHN